MKNRVFLLIGCCFVVGLGVAYAQTVDDATFQVSSGYRTFKSFAKAFAGVCAAIGAIKVFSKGAHGDSGEFRRGIVAWFGAAAFAILLPSILDVLFR